MNQFSIRTNAQYQNEVQSLQYYHAVFEHWWLGLPNPDLADDADILDFFHERGLNDLERQTLLFANNSSYLKALFWDAAFAFGVPEGTVEEGYIDDRTRSLIYRHALMQHFKLRLAELKNDPKFEGTITVSVTDDEIRIEGWSFLDTGFLG